MECINPAMPKPATSWTCTLTNCTLLKRCAVLRLSKTGHKEEIFYSEGCEILERVAQRGSGGPIPGNIPGQVGWASEQPDVVKDVPAHCRGVGTR